MEALNEGFFSWLGGLIKNLFKGIFHVNSYKQFVDRLNKMPRVILGLTDGKSNESKKVNNNEKLYEGKRSRFSKFIFEADENTEDTSTTNVEGGDNTTDANTNNNDSNTNNDATNTNADAQQNANDSNEDNSSNSRLIQLINMCKSFVDDTTKAKIEELESQVKVNEEIVKFVEESKKKEGEETVDAVLNSDSEIKSQYDAIVLYNSTLEEKLEKIVAIEDENKKREEIVSIFDSEEVKQIKQLSSKITELQNNVEQLINDKERLEKEKEEKEKENDELKGENDDLKAEIQKMKGSEYESEFKPIQNEEIDALVKSKTPSFKKTLAELLMKLRDQSAQINKKFDENTIKKLNQIIESGQVISTSDVQSMEIIVSDFLNLYTGGGMNLPKPEKDKKMTVAELAQYKNSIDKGDNSKKFKSLYDALAKVVKIYEESFNAEWKFVREREKEYEKQKAANASWDGDGSISYKTMRKIVDNEIQIQGAMESMINQCQGLIPNAIMGFFINSPVYQHTEETINNILTILLANSKNAEELSKNPELKVVSTFNDILTNTINEEEKENIDKAKNLFKEKVNKIVQTYPNKTTFTQQDGDKFEEIIQNSNIKVTAKDNADALMKKIQDVKCRLTLACLYFVYMNKPLSVTENIDGQNVDLFNVGESNQQNQNNQQQNQNNQNNQQNQQNQQQNTQGQQNQQNQQPSATNNPQGNVNASAMTKRSRLKKIYDMYTWQK